MRKYKTKEAETLHKWILTFHSKQSRLADEIGISKATMTNVLREKHEMSFETKYKIDKWLSRDDIHEMVVDFIHES